MSRLCVQSLLSLDRSLASMFSPHRICMQRFCCHKLCRASTPRTRRTRRFRRRCGCCCSSSSNWWVHSACHSTLVCMLMYQYDVCICACTYARFCACVCMWVFEAKPSVSGVQQLVHVVVDSGYRIFVDSLVYSSAKTMMCRTYHFFAQIYKGNRISDVTKALSGGHGNPCGCGAVERVI